MTEPQPETITVTLTLSKRTAALLEVLTGAKFGPADLHGVIMELIDHAQQGVYRPGAWERDWLCSVFGYDWPAQLEPDPTRPTPDGRLPFQRPREDTDGSCH